MPVSKKVVKCKVQFCKSSLKVGQLYEAEILDEPGIHAATKGLRINGVRYTVLGFDEASAIDKLRYYNRRKKDESR